MYAVQRAEPEYGRLQKLPWPTWEIVGRTWKWRGTKDEAVVVGGEALHLPRNAPAELGGLPRLGLRGREHFIVKRVQIILEAEFPTWTETGPVATDIPMAGRLGRTNERRGERRGERGDGLEDRRLVPSHPVRS